jgi:hypothetical protein
MNGKLEVNWVKVVGGLILAATMRAAAGDGVGDVRTGLSEGAWRHSRSAFTKSKIENLSK